VYLILALGAIWLLMRSGGKPWRVPGGAGGGGHAAALGFYRALKPARTTRTTRTGSPCTGRWRSSGSRQCGSWSSG
jgi:hypothetical protein